jgi:ATP-binding cassette subfamily F protein 3
VALAKITLERANLLLLDEPTNHLDLESREALEEALAEFDGTVVFISHDRAFLSALSTRVWSFRDGRIEDYPGGFDDWREWSARRETEPAGERGQGTGDRGQPAGAPVAPKASGGLSKNELRRREAELRRLEERIHALEARIAEIEAALGDPALYAAGADASRPKALVAERDAAQAELAAAYAAWEKVGEELAGV